jgi:catecholate siderophore receptor
MATRRQEPRTSARKQRLALLIRTHFAPAAFGLACALPLAAAAQSAPSGKDGEKATTLPEVKVRAEEERADGPVEGYRATRSSTFTKTDIPVKEVPASITIVPSQLIKDASLQSLGELFHYVPGAVMHQGEGNRDQIVIRGTSSTADFYVNGVRDDAQVYRDLYNAERVEVLKGPGGMIFGRGGAGGIVNRVTKRPVFSPVHEASVTAGGHSQLRGAADLGNKIGEAAAWRVNAMAERSDSFRDGVELERWAVNPVISLVPDSRAIVTFDYEHQDDERTADRGIPSQNGRPYETSPHQFFGNAGQSRAHSYFDTLAAVLDYDLTGGWQLRNTLRYTRYHKYYQNVYPGSAVNAAGNMTISAYNNLNERDNVFNQADFTRRLTWGSTRHNVLAGIELGHQDSDNLRNTGFFGTSTAATVSAANPYAVATAFRQNGTDANNNVKGDVAAAYLQDFVEITPEWKVLAGVRYDHFKVDFDDKRTTTPAVDLARTDNEWSPRAGLVWTPSPSSAYYVSYGYAFLPSGEQLSLATTTQDLAPEKSINYEVGARWDVLPKLTLSAALYRTLRQDVRVADPANIGQFLHSGEQRSQGLELGVQGEVMPGWSVFGGYSRMNAEVTSPVTSGTAAVPSAVIPAGNKLALSPENTFSLWNRVDFGWGWGAGVGVIYQGESFTSINNSVRLPAYTRVDAAVYYTFKGGRSRLALNAENLGDRKYYPTVDGDNNISPGAPRNARLTYSQSF